MKRTTNRKDAYQQITDQIVELMETAGTNWVKPWASAAAGMHHNAKSKKNYRGINVLLTGASASRKGFASTAWATFKQWQEAGGQVRKGERGTEIVFWKQIEVEDEDATGRKTKKKIPLLRTYYVFNAEQVDGIEAPAPGEAPVVEPIEDRVARIIEASGAVIRHGGGRACYSPMGDYICMPEKGAFIDTPHGTAHSHYHGTLLHELTHWTGAKERLDRKLYNRFGSEAYAFEELIAETGAALLCVTLGIDPAPREDHAKYLNGWLRALKGDKKAVFTAFSQAQKAADFILAFDATDEGEDHEDERVAA